MPMWMQAINNSSSTVTVTPAAGEVIVLNSWVGFNGGTAAVKFGTTNLPAMLATGNANATTVLDSYGSRSTWAPAFTSTVPLVITPTAAITGILSGFKFTTGTTPYIPVVVGATGMASGALLSLRPPSGKVWRLLYATPSAVHSIAVTVDPDVTPVVLSSATKTAYLRGGRGDLFSWRDQPLSLVSGAPGSDIYAYLLEFNESDLLASRVLSGAIVVAPAATYDIRPPFPEEWVLDGLFRTAAYSITQMASGSAVGTAMPWTNATYAPGPFRIDNSSYIRVTNTSGSSVTFIYQGRKVN